MNNSLQNNSSNVCRSCLTESFSLKSLFSYEQLMNKKIPLCDMLMSCASILILHGDGLPENICFSCCQQVNTAYLFRKLCERSDATLRACSNMPTIDNSNIFTDQIQKNCIDDITLENKTLNESEVNRCNETIVGNEDSKTVISNSMTAEPNYFIVNTDVNNTNEEKFLIESLDVDVQEVNKCNETIVGNEDSKTVISNSMTAEPNYFIVNTDVNNTNEEKLLIESLDVDVQENNLFECDLCTMKFSTKTFLAHHKSEHTRNSFTSTDTKNKNGVVRSYNQSRTCDICNKTFRFRSNLERHKLIHTGEKPFLCNVCGKSFAQMAYLKIHSFIHSGEKPYKCQMCDRSFAAPGTLMTHLRRHTGERPYTCKICGKDFSQSGYLASHVRVHTGEKPIECKVCNRRFSQSGRLITHMRIHSGEKPYQCTMCSRTFAIKGTLKKHIRTHTGERPYKCTVCDQAFAQRGTLTTHMRVHTPKTDNDKLIRWS